MGGGGGREEGERSGEVVFVVRGASWVVGGDVALWVVGDLRSWGSAEGEWEGTPPTHPSTPLPSHTLPSPEPGQASGIRLRGQMGGGTWARAG